ncbi:MAG: NAD-dependent epimerase/dehydratase family protein [Bacteroidetes bacterium]|nr:MAG: NAD-dependent epimerase/dehydratase family protein [Bacteroidota bacterium]
MKKILITGGAGFIASCLAEKLAQDAENHVVIVDDLTTGDIEKVPHSKHDNIRFIKADVNVFEDISNIFFSFQPNYVFHYAALVGVKRTLANPVKVLNDVTGIKNILNLSKSTGVKRVYYSSSSEVYGEPVELPQHEETTPLNSRLPYAIVKNIGEAYMKAYKKEFGLDFGIFRFFNTYGPKQSKDFVISKFISRALNNDNLEVFGDGKQTRTFCFIDDNITATTNAFYQDKFVNDVVNIGSDVELTILDLANTVIKLAGSKSKIVHLPPLPEGDMTRRMPDATKMKQLIGKSFISLEEGLKKVLANTQFILGN